MYIMVTMSVWWNNKQNQNVYKEWETSQIRNNIAQMKYKTI